MTNEPILLRSPVLVLPNNHTRHHFVLITRVFSWLTALLLTTALVIALVSITGERNDLRDELGKESRELVCRTIASVSVQKAIAVRDNTLSEALVAASSGESLTALIVRLRQETVSVDKAIEEEELALIKCASI